MAPGSADFDSGWLDPRDPTSAGRASFQAWLHLQSALALDPQRARSLLEASGDPRAALHACARASVLDPRALASMHDALAAQGVGLLPISASGYPSSLRAIGDAPVALFVQGEVRALSGPLVAIVGARAATVYGLGVAREFAEELARAGVVIVSGLARGVDAAAHEGALAAGGCTVAVQARGLDRVYPAAHAGLARRIVERGALVGELPPGTPPRRPHFPLRNRLIAGMSRLVIVVEARDRSGSLITARHALDQGRDVMALPGPVTAPTSAGPNRLIRDGARPLLEPADVLEELGLETSTEGPHAAGLEPEDASPERRAIVEALSRAPASRDELARRLQRAPEQLALALLDLEISGRVAQDRDGQLTLVSAARRR